MLGFPDESESEIYNTINFAREMLDHGIDVTNFFLVMPVPGTPMFDYCIENNHLPEKFNPDKFQWTKANLRNIAIQPQKLENIRDQAWEEFNNEDFKNSRKNWRVEQ